MSVKSKSTVSLAALIAAAAMSCGAAQAQYYAAAPAYTQPQYQALPAEQAPAADARFQRQIVSYATKEAPGTIVVDTANTYLYFVLGGGQAVRYGIGVGREGFTWSGVQKVARKAEWPDWHPPAEMLERQPYLPRMTAGGPGNPMGAAAMYLGNTMYRIHGTNDPTTIGQNVSSGCIRLTNEDVQDLYSRVAIGAKVVVLPQNRPATVAQAPIQTQNRVEQSSLVSGYVPESNARRTWASIRPAGLY